jgi:hypothetical protein
LQLDMLASSVFFETSIPNTPSITESLKMNRLVSSD